MAYGSTPYRMTPEKHGSHMKSAQMTSRNVCVRLVNGIHEPYQPLSSPSMGNRIVNFAGKRR